MKRLWLIGLMLAWTHCAVTPEEVAARKEFYARAQVMEKLYAKEIAMAQSISLQNAVGYLNDRRSQAVLSDGFARPSIVALAAQESYEDSDCDTLTKSRAVYMRDDVISFDYVSEYRGDAPLDSGAYLSEGRYLTTDRKRWKTISVKRFFPDSRVIVVLHLDPKTLPDAPWTESWRAPLPPSPLTRLVERLF